LHAITIKKLALDFSRLEGLARHDVDGKVRAIAIPQVFHRADQYAGLL
jgi:hypothetical protein